jgi:hypothetical protein
MVFRSGLTRDASARVAREGHCVDAFPYWKAAEMPHYFLHFTDGEKTIKDPDGLELSGPAAARAEAITFGRELVTREEMDWTGWSVVIHDEGGRQLDAIPLLGLARTGIRAA